MRHQICNKPILILINPVKTKLCRNSYLMIIKCWNYCPSQKCKSEIQDSFLKIINFFFLNPSNLLLNLSRRKKSSLQNKWKWPFTYICVRVRNSNLQFLINLCEIGKWTLDRDLSEQKAKRNPLKTFL